MALFVDEQTNREGTVIRRMLMSNLSVAELNVEAGKLSIPQTDPFRKDRLPHYFLTQAQRLTAIEDGAQPIEWKSDLWRTVHALAVKLPR